MVGGAERRGGHGVRGLCDPPMCTSAQGTACVVKTVTWQNSRTSPPAEREAERIAREGMPAPGRAGMQRTSTGDARPEQ